MNSKLKMILYIGSRNCVPSSIAHSTFVQLRRFLTLAHISHTPFDQLCIQVRLLSCTHVTVSKHEQAHARTRTHRCVHASPPLCSYYCKMVSSTPAFGCTPLRTAPCVRALVQATAHVHFFRAHQ